MPMSRTEMGNPSAVSILLYSGKSFKHTFLRFIAVEVAVVDDAHGFACRDCCYTDNRLR